MQPRNILLVEDNENDIQLTLRALKKNGITNEIVIARTGEEALNYLFGNEPLTGKKIDQLPQVVLLDLKLPKVDGHEVLKQIREHESTRHLPVVVLTSSKEEQDILSSYHRGANSYIRKPVDFVQFTEAVKNLGMYWLLLNEIAVSKEVSNT